MNETEDGNIEAKSPDSDVETIGCSSASPTPPENPGAAAANGENSRCNIDRLHDEEGRTYVKIETPDWLSQAPSQTGAEASSAGAPSSNGYLTTSWPHATKAQVDRVADWASEHVPEHEPAARAFLTHLYVSYALKGQSFVPIAADLMRAQLPGGPRRTEELWRPLAGAGIIDAYEKYSYVWRICREFRLRPDRAAELAALGREGRSYYDLATGNARRGRGPALKTSAWAGGNRVPGLAGEALEYFGSEGARQLINLEAAEEHLDRLEQSVKHAEDSLAIAEQCFRIAHRHFEPDSNPARRTEVHLEARREALRRLQGRFANDQQALAVIRGQNPRRAPDMPAGIYEYAPAYRVQELSGRIGFERGGPQSASRALKQAAYSDVPGLRNYDIKSCHTMALRRLASTAAADGVEISTKPLDDYLARGGKTAAAEATGLPVNLVKKTGHAVKMGAGLPESMEEAWNRAKRRARERFSGRRLTRGMIRRELPDVARLASRHAPQDPDRALRLLRKTFGPIRTMVRKLAGYLCGTFWERRRQRGGRGGWHVRNAGGVAINPTRYEEGHTRRSKMMAWYLQGLESAHVHALTTRGTTYGYEPIGNEHDGLITLGAIPEAAEEEARRMSGFAEATLAEKPFTDEKELELFYAGAA